MPDKPTCYQCQYRGTVPGDAHSCCKYPGTSTNIFDIFNPKNREIAIELKIQANPHGIRSGWFIWPVNFDPAWLENCNGFEAK
jgi:hypothetical protein